MRVILHCWRESGGGAFGGPLEWWDAMSDGDQAMVLGEFRVRDWEYRVWSKQQAARARRR